MKIQCNVCEMAEATVLCCADEAALCWACDENIHAANKLASKHQRVPLSGSSSQMPRCDICQEASGYIFCLEDRALLCRKCDVAIHTANTCVTGHQRFLLTGVKVALEPTDPIPCSSIANSHSREISTKTKVRPPSDKEFSMPSSGEFSRSLSVQGGSDDFMTNRTLLTGDSASGGFSQWQIDELINLTGFNQNYGFMDNGSSKADSGKLGDSDSSPSLRAADVELDNDDECSGHIPEASWTVPQVPSPPTASGLYWPRSYHNSMMVLFLFLISALQKGFDIAHATVCSRNEGGSFRCLNAGIGLHCLCSERLLALLCAYRLSQLHLFYNKWTRPKIIA